MVQDAFASIKGSRVLAAPAAGMEGLWAWQKGMLLGSVGNALGRPSAWAGGSSLDIGPISPGDGKEGLRLYDLSRDISGRPGFDFVGEPNDDWLRSEERRVGKGGFSTAST